ncbi:MAG: TonB-dependent receptor [Caulobacteraceae bacterium]
MQLKAKAHAAIRLLAVSALALGGGGGALAATAASYRFAIPSKPTAEALIDFAVQAGVSVGGNVKCTGRSDALVGRYTLKEGLQRLLGGGGCAFELLDPQTVRIVAARRPPAAAIRPGPPPAPAPVIAASDPDEVFRASEIVVTTTKRAATVDKLPYASSVVAGEDLRILGARDTASVARQMVGVTVTNLGSGRNKILLRGLSDGAFTGRTQSTVGAYFDNVPIIYNAPDPDLKLMDIESVEVLRGPQGALYGAGSLTGVYRIVTRKPELDTLSARILAIASATQGGSPGYEVQAGFNAPLVAGRTAVRAVAYREVEGGYLDDVNLRLSNVDRTTRTGGRMALRTLLSPDWTLTIGVNARRLDSTDTQYTVPSLGRFRRANQVRETHANDFGIGYATVEGSGAWGRLSSTTGIVRHRFSSRYDATASLSQFDTEGADVGIYDEHSSIRMLVHDTYLTSPNVGPFQWLAGVFVSSSREDTRSLLRAQGVPFVLPSTLYSEARTDRLREAALYGEASYAVTPRWTVTAGLRGFSTTVRTTSSVTVAFPGQSREFSDQATFSGLSPKLAVSYDLSGGRMLYAVASEGYRAGGFNTGGLTVASLATDSRFRPDRLWNFETGVKGAIFDGRLKFRTAAFYDIWKDIQTDQYFRSGLSYTTNIGDGRNYGLETELVFTPTQRLSIQANALFNEPKLTRTAVASLSRTDIGLPGVPDVSFSGLVVYQRPLTPRLSLVLTGEVGYIGRSRLTFDPALSPEMGGYGTGRLSAQLKTRAWRLALFIDNPANVAGDTFAYGNPFSFGQVRQVTPQRPRTVSLALSADF